MSGVSVEDIQEEFADLDLDITDGDVLIKIKVGRFEVGRKGRIKDF